MLHGPLDRKMSKMAVKQTRPGHIPVLIGLLSLIYSKEYSLRTYYVPDTLYIFPFGPSKSVLSWHASKPV